MTELEDLYPQNSSFCIILKNYVDFSIEEKKLTINAKLVLRIYQRVKFLYYLLCGKVSSSVLMKNLE